MYAILLTIHSWFRWLVLAGLVITLIRYYHGWFTGRKLSQVDAVTQSTTVKIVQTQFLIGLALYVFSPMVRYFLFNFSTAVHQRDARFFGMEHITMMFIAVAVITVGSEKALKKVTEKQKFMTIAIWFSVGLLIIFLSIPWEFSPFTRRPYFRIF
jgi:hypothetical protein